MKKFQITNFRKLVFGLTQVKSIIRIKVFSKVTRGQFFYLQNSSTSITEKSISEFKIFKKNPEISRSKLIWVNETVHSWLYKNNKVWLQGNYPPIKNYPTGQKLFDWNERDKETAPNIKELVAELKLLPGRPIFFSKSILYRRLKIANLLKRPQFVPKTIEDLEIYSETFGEYALRRIEWGIEEYVKENKPVNQFAFMKLTGITPKCLSNNPSVKVKFYEALETIKSLVTNI